MVRSAETNGGRRPVADGGFAIALAIAVAVCTVAVVLAVAGLIRDGLPPSRAVAARQTAARTVELAALVPADALAYVHVALDRRRAEVAASLKLAGQFPAARSVGDAVVRALTAPDCDRATIALKSASDAAFALLETSSGRGAATAGSLLIFSGARRAEADDGRRARCGALQSEYRGQRLLIGQAASLDAAAALARAKGRDRSLAAADLARKRFAALPPQRVLSGWLSADGLRRLLAPQGGAIGLGAVLIDRPALRGLAFSLATGSSELRLRFASALDPEIVRKQGRPETIAGDDIAELIPRAALAALVTTRVDRALKRLPEANSDRLSAAALGSLPAAVRELLRPTTAAFLSVTEDRRSILTIVAPVRSEADARRRIARLSKRMRKIFVTAVTDRHVILATDRRGLKLAANRADSLAASKDWSAAVTADWVKRPAGSLIFVDFRKLLSLAERAGLGNDPTYRAVSADLDRITAVGGRMRTAMTESTLDLSLLLKP